MSTRFYSREVTTPLGAMFAVGGDAGLILCEFADRPMLPTQMERIARICGEAPTPGSHAVLDQTQRELDDYFEGRLERFTIPLVLDGTPFQMGVWNELLTIPFGRTTSYDAIAMRLDRRGGARAVGRANGDNRIAIIVPCHRVINSDGTMSGYGGGKHRKRWLLDHESRGEQLALV